MGGETILIKQNEYIRKFKKADAIDPHSARPLDELRVRNNHIFRGLLHKGVFVEAGNDRYYIDLDQTAEFMAGRRKAALFIGLAIIIGIIVLLLLGKLK
ncbi:MAG: hypothetical protein NTZ26_00205 [Candidatus Aminicenantes bacterium]|nr:hypothetical protein [Candidatus Aminicenantes bacterium]